MTFTDLIRGFWRRLWRRRWLGDVIVVDAMEDVPSALGNRLYVVGRTNAKWALLDCPCRCGERINVNLMTSRRPSWHLTVKNKRASLEPSLWVPEEKCGSHFWIRDSHISWVP